MSRNAILANPEHYIFKIFQRSRPPDPLDSLKKFFSPPRGSKIFFRIDFPPKQKILDRTLKRIKFLPFSSKIRTFLKKFLYHLLLNVIRQVHAKIKNCKERWQTTHPLLIRAEATNLFIIVLEALSKGRLSLPSNNKTFLCQSGLVIKLDVAMPLADQHTPK